MTRRDWLKSLVPVSIGLAAASRAEAAASDAFEQRLAELERSSGGRLGVAVLDARTGAFWGRRVSERFALCSTSKVLIVGAVLARVDHGRDDLDRRVRVEQAELLEYAPVAKAHAGGSITLRELCSAAVEVSDNTAANLLLASVGGPAGMTAFARALGDQVTRLDRNEPALNEAIPGDPRDTTSPAAMVDDLRALVLGTALSASSRELLAGWMLRCSTGGHRLRAGLPSGWQIADKTGTGDHGTANDVAVIWPEGRKPLVVAAFLTGATVGRDAQEAVLAGVGRAVAESQEQRRN